MMKQMNLKCLLLILAFSFGLNVLLPAQLWTSDFSKEINVLKTTDVGVALVGTDEGLYGVDNTGKTLWENTDLKKIKPEYVEIFQGSELAFIIDKGMLGRNRVINVETGEIYGEELYIASAILVPPMNSILAFDGNEQAYFIDIATNTTKWTLKRDEAFWYGLHYTHLGGLKATIKGNQPITYISKSEAIIHFSVGSLAFLDLNTGKPKWFFDFDQYKFRKPGKKEPDQISAPVLGYSMMKLSKDKSTLYFPFRNELLAIDIQTGQTKWAQKVHKLGGKVRDLYETDKGIVLLSYSGVHLLNPEDGTQVWDKPIKVKGASEGLLLPDGNTFYTVSKKYVVRLDLDHGKAEQLTDKIKFQGNESFTNLEVFDDLIVLSSTQNVAGINKSTGDIEYQLYLKPPGPGLVEIAQNAALAAVAAAATVNSYNLNKANSGGGSFDYFSYTPRYMESKGTGTVENAKYMYISTKFKDGSETGFGIGRVDKKIGEVAERIIIGDRDPIYEVDNRFGYIYYLNGKKILACKKLN